MARGTGTKDRTAPVVTITSPLSGASYTTSQTITITATATDNKAVARVEFYVRDAYTGVTTFLATDTSSPYSTTWTIPTVNGNYVLTARAFDAAGNQGEHLISIFKTDSTTTTTTTVPVPPPTLPSSKILNVPTAFYQGSEGSCVSCAVALQASIEKYYYTNNTTYSQSTNILSPEWIYNYNLCGDDPLNPLSFCGNCGNGSWISTSLDIMYKKGAPRWSVCPYSYQNGCTTAGFTQAMTDDAALSKFTNYGYTLSSDIYQMKRLICNNHPLSFVFTMDTNYYNSTCGYIWNSRGDYMSSHALVIIGYDDSKNAWLAQNSWGTSWSCNGQIWIDYNFMTTLAGNVYWGTMRPDKNLFPIL